MDIIGTATQTELAKLVGVSQQAIAKFMADHPDLRSSRGAIDPRAFLLAYCEQHREQAAGRAPQDGISGESLDLVQERARLAKEQADKLEMENALARKQIIPSREVVAGWQTIIVNCRAKLLAIPSKVAPALINLSEPRIIQDKLTKCVHEALDELSRTRAVPTVRKAKPKTRKKTAEQRERLT